MKYKKMTKKVKVIELDPNRKKYIYNNDTEETTKKYYFTIEDVTYYFTTSENLRKDDYFIFNLSTYILTDKNENEISISTTEITGAIELTPWINVPKWSDDYVNIGASAKNVFCKDGNTVEDKINNLNHYYVEKDGSTMTGQLVTPALTVGTRANNSFIGENSISTGAKHKATGNYSHAEGGGWETSSSSATLEITKQNPGVLVLYYTNPQVGEYIRYQGEEYEILSVTQIVSKVSYQITLSEGYPFTNGTYNVSVINYRLLYNTASAEGSHAEGANTKASGRFSHAEGYSTIANEDGAHAEGSTTTASGYSSHAEGISTVANGTNAHAEGYSTQAIGSSSHAEGTFTIAQGNYQHTEGKYNIEGSDYAHIIGNGTSSVLKSNAYTLDWEGNAWFSGDVYTGSTSGTNKDEGSKKLATEDYIDSSLIEYEKLINKVTNITEESTDEQYPTARAVYQTIGNIPKGMMFKGSLGEGGTIELLPEPTEFNEGFMYKVITPGEYYEGKIAKIGDVYISDGITWVLIPSGDEPSGTVTSIALQGSYPIQINDSSPITDSGVRTISHSNSGIEPGTYKSVTVDAYGHITEGTNPTTLAGYGITDAASSEYASIKKLDAISISDGEDFQIANGMYLISSLTVNGTIDELFTNSLIRIYTSGNYRFIVLLDSANQYYQWANNFYFSRRWNFSSTNLTWTLGDDKGYQFSSTDLTPGTSPLATGYLYFVYE